MTCVSAGPWGGGSWAWDQQVAVQRAGGSAADATDQALDGKGPQRRPQRRLGRRLEEVAKAVGGRLLSVTKCH